MSLNKPCFTWAIILTSRAIQIKWFLKHTKGKMYHSIWGVSPSVLYPILLPVQFHHSHKTTLPYSKKFKFLQHKVLIFNYNVTMLSMMTVTLHVHFKLYLHKYVLFCFDSCKWEYISIYRNSAIAVAIKTFVTFICCSFNLFIAWFLVIYVFSHM